MKFQAITAGAVLSLALGSPALAEGYIFQGSAGFVNEFPLIGGTYQLWVDAHWNPASTWTSRTQTCSFEPEESAQ